MTDSTIGEKQERLHEAALRTAHLLSSYEEEILSSLRQTEKADIADELYDSMQRWRDAGQQFLEHIVTYANTHPDPDDDTDYTQA